MGCLICFPCEKRILSAKLLPVPELQPKRLLKLYDGKAVAPQ